LAYKTPKYKRAYIVWTDHCEHCGWVDAKTVTGPLPLCYSVGWVLKETKDYVFLAPHLATDEEGNVDVTGVMQIDKANIKKRMSFRYEK
jgi:beta-lactamase class D